MDALKQLEQMAKSASMVPQSAIEKMDQALGSRGLSHYTRDLQTLWQDLKLRLKAGIKGGDPGNVDLIQQMYELASYALAIRLACDDMLDAKDMIIRLIKDEDRHPML
jgi:hypothetical protein